MLISRSEARKEGKLHYFTGVPCQNGHVAQRMVTSGRCVDCDAMVARAPGATPRTVMTRKEAWRAGHTHYYTGTPCAQGHDSLRYVSTGNCTECARSYTQAGRARYVERRPGVVVLRGLTVPRKHLPAILAMVDAFMAAEGLLLGPPPVQVEPQPGLTPDAAAAAARALHTPPEAS
jgi:hypothetical protein